MSFHQRITATLHGVGNAFYWARFGVAVAVVDPIRAFRADVARLRYFAGL